MNRQTWTNEWPQDPGACWFHGTLYPGDEPETRLVRTHRNESGGLSLATEGVALYRTKGSEGVFTPCEIPGPPGK